MTDQNFQQQLAEHRKEIDLCDKQIIEALAKRMEVVEKVGVLKKQHNVPPLDPSRWQQVVETRKAMAQQLGLKPELVGAIWEIFHQYALELEAKV
ncbi:hypothetical protein COS31_00735 [Candidatus Roizmanbacteria bacterium CG02_land_8_20_14_3_00_36_15]|uniref:Chorismate mutase domain-containing protein n=4 Tax=Candidatus Roizmaniibacteriota TaxID=1752723 RepID=A0A2M8EXX3_9BACT|nr:MAG: hypothetical protein COV86_04370 [Candidatus Roizmanbacteria bacterium CG11_big_fil_rev_8_21_14_0_20_35_14]PIV09079.1 MAG: hypothetical protein COS51_04950 [Candidatus Roizmanbacteria bacterium CG03_land_8_20_14_0_80_36_21]PIV38187.1 MAG: hypothetical protein COS31_00735 [Candidatus Roizmanbacteria bacterium CG02_land_8_20_14_3_00_36_15]PIY70227.1 MAG: hypothetical protein COY89_02290 [Candidatus Roizmanbacteria bacterium CG_4_10_14_0_8_um_filter_36_36]PJA52954.1 MAG: hypothetical prote